MKAILQHLRFPFSFLLMPLFWFSLNFVDSEKIFHYNSLLLFLILHFLVYPSSNAYNSTQDRDGGSVGLIKNPLPVPQSLFAITMVLDIFAIVFSWFINYQTAMLVAVYILFSRLYSWRKIRLKQYPILGFMTVFICQGALLFFIVQAASNFNFWFSTHLKSYFLAAFISSLFIGSMYPLSQIYQHEQDRQDGVITISAMLGYRNTFLFSGSQFLMANSIILFFFIYDKLWLECTIYIVCQVPVIVFFLFWFYKVMKDNKAANYKNTMRMNVISAICMNICFIILLLLKLLNVLNFC